MDPRPVQERPARSAAIVNLGCKVNQSEMDAVERLLRARGVEIVDPDAGADLVVVNTCAVTTVADQKSRHAVRRARRANPEARALVTGCSVRLTPAAFAAADPSAELFDADRDSDLPAGVLGRGSGSTGLLSRLEATLDGWGCVPQLDETTRIERTRAFIKVQDGCSFHCTYCIVPRARGGPRSARSRDVLTDVRAAVAAGHREIVLTGINVGCYQGDGGDADRPGDGGTLAGLVREIVRATDVERIRLSSIEPQHVTAELLDVWAAARGRCLPHFHVPLQSGDDGILRRMGRRYTADGYREAIAGIRQAIPLAAIHADVIAGFPGEDDAAWSNTMALLREIDLAGIHVFRFSARPGTAAAQMTGQVDETTKKRRSSEALALASAGRARFARRQIGADLEVLFESRLQDGRWLGHAENYVSVVVGGIAADLQDRIAIVRATSIDPHVPDRVVGEIVAVRGSPRTASREATPRSPAVDRARAAPTAVS